MGDCIRSGVRVGVGAQEGGDPHPEPPPSPSGAAAIDAQATVQDGCHLGGMCGGVAVLSLWYPTQRRRKNKSDSATMSNTDDAVH